MPLKKKKCHPDNAVDLNLFIFCRWSNIPKPSTYHLAHKNLCLSTDQQRPLPAHFQTRPRGGKSSYCPPEQTSEVANTMCEVVGGGERGPMGARAVLTRLKLVFPRLLSCCLSIAHSDSRQLKFLFEDVLLLDCVPILREPTHCYWCNWYLMPSQKLFLTIQEAR